jgi:Helix-turn-helix domain
MKKTNPSNLTANWSVISLRAPWEYVTSAELAKVLGVHLQTVNNWTIRGKLKPAPRSPQRRGNKNYFLVSYLRSWLEGKNEDDLVREWVKNDVDYDNLTDAQINWLMATLYKVS